MRPATVTVSVSYEWCSYRPPALAAATGSPSVNAADGSILYEWHS
jgi:hypothetical protein